MFACKCLNTTIQALTEGAFNPEFVNKIEQVPHHPFFDEGTQLCSVQKINYVHSCLVEQHTVNLWTLFECLNCNMITHGMSKVNGQTVTLLSCKLLGKSEINSIKASDSFSKVFKIVINSADDKFNLEQYDYLPADLELKVNYLKNMANDSINMEDNAVEERIRIYTENEYSNLESFKENTIRDQRTLIQKILNRKLHQSKSQTTAGLLNRNSPRKVPENYALSSRVNSTINHNTISDGLPKQRRMDTMSPSTQQVPDNLHHFPRIPDEETMFQLEGINDPQKFYQGNTDDEVSEAEEADEKQIGRARRTEPQPVNMAKSLPMKIPVFMPVGSHDNEDSEDNAGDDEPRDIAASIKALAQSLHGDAVFGELPRPRCRTNI